MLVVDMISTLSNTYQYVLTPADMRHRVIIHCVSAHVIRVSVATWCVHVSLYIVGAVPHTPMILIPVSMDMYMCDDVTAPHMMVLHAVQDESMDCSTITSSHDAMSCTHTSDHTTSDKDPYMIYRCPDTMHCTLHR